MNRSGFLFLVSIAVAGCATDEGISSPAGRYELTGYLANDTRHPLPYSSETAPGDTLVWYSASMVVRTDSTWEIRWLRAHCSNGSCEAQRSDTSYGTWQRVPTQAEDDFTLELTFVPPLPLTPTTGAAIRGSQLVYAEHWVFRRHT